MQISHDALRVAVQPPLDLDIKNTLKFDRPFDCVDFELLLFKSRYKTWSENEVLKHGLTTTLSTPGI